MVRSDIVKIVYIW